MKKTPLTYYLLKLNSKIKSPRIKFIGLWLLHKLGKRYLAVNFDPVNQCNLRCKMCYFTDENYVKKLKGIFPVEDLDLWAKRILPRALKLQVGCGTEPTLYKNLDKIFQLGKKYKVPHISLTTNANLLNSDKLESWVMSGLQEITISLHGVKKSTYEWLMGRGNYEKFHKSLKIISDLKKKHPEFVLRINYTFNEDNFKELNSFFKVFGKYDIDIIQLRPISKIGETAYNNFSLQKIIPVYDEFIHNFKQKAKENDITLLAPASKNNLKERASEESLIYYFTYVYISPSIFWKEDFDWKKETYNAYFSRKKLGTKMLKLAFSSSKKLKEIQRSQNLNYKVDIS